MILIEPTIQASFGRALRQRTLAVFLKEAARAVGLEPLLQASPAATVDLGSWSRVTAAAAEEEEEQTTLTDLEAWAEMASFTTGHQAIQMVEMAARTAPEQPVEAGAPVGLTTR